MSVYVIDTLKPKNGLDFPVVEAIDVAVEGYSSLADAVSHFATDTAIAALTAALDGKADKTTTDSLQAQINQIVISASAESVVAPEVAAARVGADSTSYSTLKERLDAENAATKSDISKLESQTITIPNPNNIYDSRNDTSLNPTINRAHVDLYGYSGNLCVSTLGNYAAYFSNLSVVDAEGNDLGISFGTDYIWNDRATRRGVVISIPSNAVSLSFAYQHHSSGGALLVSEIMISESSTVPSSYEEYSAKYKFVDDDYATVEELEAAEGNIADISSSVEDIDIRLTHQEEKIVTIPNPINIYDSENDVVINSTVNRATVYLGGFSGDLCFSTYGNYAVYLTGLSVTDINGNDLGISFGDDYIWNETTTRRGVIVTIPSGAYKLTFNYQHHSAGGDVVVSQLMVSESDTVPNSYIEYSAYYEFASSDYARESDISNISSEVAAISSIIETVPDPENIYNSADDDVLSIYLKRAHVDLRGYSGNLCVSTLGNYAAYFTDLSVVDAEGNDLGVSFGTDYIWNERTTRRGVVITIPSTAVSMSFTYRYHSEAIDVLVSEVMVSEGGTVPNYYIPYSPKYQFTDSNYVTRDEFDPSPIVYVAPDGDDENDGLTPETAVATFTNAFSKSHTIRAMRGEYHETIIVSHIKGIDIKPYDQPTYSHEEPVRGKIVIIGNAATSVNVANFDYCDNMLLEDIIFSTASGSVVSIHNSNSCIISSCEAEGSVNAMGFEIVNTDAVFNNCYATNNHYDGFNFHGYGTTVMNDCVSEDNTDDGCSHHDGCIGTINGGRFSRNGKAGIAPAYGAQVNIYNVIADHNLIGIGYLSTDNGHAAMTGTVNSCVLIGNSNVGLLAQQLCTVTAINCKYSENELDKSGIAYEY